MISLKIDKDNAAPIRRPGWESPSWQLHPTPEVPILQTTSTLVSDYKGLSKLAEVNLTSIRPEPKMEYEVWEDGEWLSVEKGEEMSGGILRYIKDGFGKTALPGNWRGKMTNEYAEELAQYENQQVVLAARKVRSQVRWGIAIVVMFVLIILMY